MRITKILSFLVVMMLTALFAGCTSNNNTPSDSNTPTPTPTETETNIPSAQNDYLSYEEETSDADKIVNTTPAVNAAGVSANRIKNGTYSIDVESDTSLFKIIDCQLTVEDNSMTAVITMSGQGFGKVYMGTAEQAIADPGNQHEATLIDEKNTFTVPVTALDIDIDCAGFGTKSGNWYDHIVVFESANIPGDAFIPCQIDVEMAGGSGKASIQSPATLTYRDGADYAEIIWSSSNYTYMIVDGEEYLPVNTEGNSTFEIPVVLDRDMVVIACTAAMSEPKEIEYTLHFDSSSMIKL